MLRARKYRLNSHVRLISRQVQNGVDHSAVGGGFGETEIGARFPAQRGEGNWVADISEGLREMTRRRI